MGSECHRRGCRQKRICSKLTCTSSRWQQLSPLGPIMGTFATFPFSVSNFVTEVWQ